MLTFTLAISCLTTSNLCWFMDLTFQVPMQYYLHHRTLLQSPVTSTSLCCFCFGSAINVHINEHTCKFLKWDSHYEFLSWCSRSTFSLKQHLDHNFFFWKTSRRMKLIIYPKGKKVLIYYEYSFWGISKHINLFYHIYIVNYGYIDHSQSTNVAFLLIRESEYFP